MNVVLPATKLLGLFGLLKKKSNSTGEEHPLMKNHSCALGKGCLWGLRSLLGLFSGSMRAGQEDVLALPRSQQSGDPQNRLSALAKRPPAAP